MVEGTLVTAAIANIGSNEMFLINVVGAAFQTERDPAMYQSGCDMTRTYSIVDAVARTRVAFVRMVP